MKKQQYSNHVRYYAPHHFVFLPLMTGFTILGFVKAFQVPAHQLEWLLFGILSFCILYLAVMLHQHYALGNQDRIVRLEFRLRYWQLFGESSAIAEQNLNFSQIAALRFANDPEFKRLITIVTEQHLDAGSIKKSISDWQADNMRL